MANADEKLTLPHTEEEWTEWMGRLSQEDFDRAINLDGWLRGRGHENGIMTSLDDLQPLERKALLRLLSAPDEQDEEPPEEGDEGDDSADEPERRSASGGLTLSGSALRMLRGMGQG